MLHAGVLKKFGLYGIIRIAMPMLPDGFQAWEGLIFVLLLGNIIYVGFVTIAQNQLDKMLGNSSVMHMGYAFLGIACFNEIGWNRDFGDPEKSGMFLSFARCHVKSNEIV